jgi:hypothetical protein
MCLICKLAQASRLLQCIQFESLTRYRLRFLFLLGACEVLPRKRLRPFHPSLPTSPNNTIFPHLSSPNNKGAELCLSHQKIRDFSHDKTWFCAQTEESPEGPCITRYPPTLLLLLLRLNKCISTQCLHSCFTSTVKFIMSWIKVSLHIASLRPCPGILIR